MATETQKADSVKLAQVAEIATAMGVDPSRGGAFLCVVGFFKGVTTFTPSEPGADTYHTLSVNVSGGSVKVSCDPASDAWQQLQGFKKGQPITLVCTGSVESNGRVKGDANQLGGLVKVL